MQCFTLSLPKKVLGSSVVAAATCALCALAAYVVANRTTLGSDELSAAAIIGAFVALTGACGFALVTFRVSLGDDVVIIRGLFRERRYHASELAGFGVLILVVSVVPMTYIRLYGKGLREIAKIQIARRNRDEIEAWFAARLPLVRDEGSAVRPKLRIVAYPTRAQPTAMQPPPQ